MKLINNRYRIINMLKDSNEETYLVEDLLNKSERKILRIFDCEKNNKIISYFIDYFIEFEQIRHKNLLNSYEFDIIETINMKKTSVKLYLSTSEFFEAETLDKVKTDLNFEQKLNIILDLMSVLDFLHFRGFVYKYLSPEHILYTKENYIKLLNISSTLEKILNSKFNKQTENFIAPEIIMDLNNNLNDKRSDYYSMGMIMRYLLCDDGLNDDDCTELNLKEEEKIVLLDIINNLTDKDINKRNISLRKHIENITSRFNLPYKYDLKNERNVVFLRTKLVGRDNEIEKVLKIDSEIIKNTNTLYGLKISGYIGSGKTRFLEEIIYKLKMNGRLIHKVDIIPNDTLGINNIVNFLKQIMFNVSNDLLDKYKDDFSRLLPDLSKDKESQYIDFGKINEKYRIFNRISGFINDISKENVVYIIVDGFEKANDIFISFIEYLIEHAKLNKFFLILAYNEGILNVKLLDKLNNWVDKNLIGSIALNNLSEDSTGLLVKSILGISYVPKNFSAILYKESKGNPGFIDFMINDLFNRGELLISSNGNWHTKKDDYSEIHFSTNFFDAIKSQLGRFDDDYLNVLKTISVFNSILSKKVLLSITDMDPERLDIVLDELVIERIIERQIVEWGYNYYIFSDELKRYLYWNLSDDEKSTIHKKAADVILDLYGDRVNNIIDEVVHHLVNSNNNDLALKLVFEEANKIVNKYSLNAIVLWEKAYTIVRDNDIENRLKILYELTDIFAAKGTDEKLDIYLNELFNLSIETKSIEYEIKTRFYRTEIFLRTNQLEKLSTEIGILEKISRENQIPEGIICSTIAKARMLVSNNNIESINSIMNEAIELSYKFNLRKYLGSIYIVLGYVEYLKGSTEDSIEYYSTSLKYFEKDNNIYEMLKPINNLGVMYSDIYGDIETGLNYYKQGLEIVSDYGFSQLETMLLNNIGELYLNVLDYDKALEYILSSRRMALEINDYRLILLSHINLGYINLLTNKLDKAYKCYVFLRESYQKNPILEEEIKCQYFNFLGEFYLSFGYLDLSLENSKLASDISKDVNIKEHLRAKSRILFLKYLKNGYIDRNEINSINLRYQKAGIKYENLRNILKMCKLLCLLNGDKNLASQLLVEYHTLSKGIENKYLNTIGKLTELMLTGTKQSFKDIESILLSLNSSEFIQGDIDLKYFIGKMYLGLADYSKALSFSFDAFDTLYKSVKAIDDFEFKYNLINAKNGDKIKENINEIFEKVFSKRIEYILLSNANKVNLDQYFDFSEIINSLTKDEFNELVRLKEYILNIKTLDDLLLSLNEDYQYNLDLILRFLCKETLAQRGYIFINNENEGYEIISNNSDDLNLPKEVFLMQALRSREPLLIDRKTKELNKRYIDFLPNDLTGVICAPIVIYDYDENTYDRRKHESIQNNEVSGYIYLETDSVLNRFDRERCSLICSITNLIFLNIENKKLKLMSTTDKLTNLYTRKYFEDRMESLLNLYKYSGNNFSLLMIDIDKFKNINDNYGHLKGDEVLYYIGKIVKNNIRSTDIVGRYGGEEIIVILQNTNINNGIEIAEKIRSKIQELEVPGVNLPITVSIGLSQYPNHSHFKDELINKADQALYYAKEVLGRNSVALWNDGMEKVFNKTEKVYGIITGNTIIDNRNVLAIIETSELIIKNKCYRKRAYEFLSKLLNTVEGEYGSLIQVKDNRPTSSLTRQRRVAAWVENYINYNLVEKVITSKTGEYLIDWENVEDIDKTTGNPNWQSIIVLPLIKNDEVIAVVYITVPLKEKEFNFNNFNMISVLGNIFTSNL